MVQFDNILQELSSVTIASVSVLLVFANIAFIAMLMGWGLAAAGRFKA